MDIYKQINSLPESKMVVALNIIRDNMPNRVVRLIAKAEIISQNFLAADTMKQRQPFEVETLQVNIDDLPEGVLRKLQTFLATQEQQRRHFLKGKKQAPSKREIEVQIVTQTKMAHDAIIGDSEA